MGLTAHLQKMAHFICQTKDTNLKLLLVQVAMQVLILGKKTGLVKKMTDERAQLLKIHCANHCVELAAKEVIINSKFKTVDNIYRILFDLLKNLEKNKRYHPRGM